VNEDLIDESASGDREPASAPATTKPRARRARTIFAVVLIVVGSLFAWLSVLTVWTKTTLLDTDQYVSTVAPLAQNQDMREAVATRVTKRLMSEQALVSQLEAKVPARLRNRLPDLQAAVESLVYEAALKLVSSDQFAKVWEGANRRAQQQVVAALTGNTGKLDLANDGTVSLDLSGVAKQVRARLEARGLDLSKLPSGKIDTSVELFRWPWLGWVQDGVDLLQKLAWLLPLVTLACYGGAVALSTRRRRTLAWVGVGFSAAMLVILVAIAVGRGPYLELFSQPEGRQAGGAAYDEILKGLRLEVRGLFVLGLVIAAGAWLVGRQRRAAVAAGAGAAETGVGGRAAEESTTTKVATGGVVVLGVIALAALDTITAVGVLVIAACVLAGVALVQYLGRRHRAGIDAPVEGAELH
jgi:hypothetical protein